MALVVTNQMFLKGLAQAAVLTRWPEAWPFTDLHLNLPQIKLPITEALQNVPKETTYLKYFIETSVQGLKKEDSHFANSFYNFCVEFVNGRESILGHTDFLALAKALLSGSPIFDYFMRINISEAFENEQKAKHRIEKELQKQHEKAIRQELFDTAKAEQEEEAHRLMYAIESANSRQDKFNNLSAQEKAYTVQDARAEQELQAEAMQPEASEGPEVPEVPETENEMPAEMPENEMPETEMPETEMPEEQPEMPAMQPEMQPEMQQQVRPKLLRLDNESVVSNSSPENDPAFLKILLRKKK